MLDYGIIGNCITSALVKKNGSIDWMCFPNFSSPSIFAKIIDKEKGGSLEINPTGKFETSQSYVGESAILETVFTSEDKSQVFKVVDFFPRYKKLTKNMHQRLIKKNSLIRIITPLKGKPKVKVKYDPRPNYSKEDCEYSGKSQLVCSTKTKKIVMVSNIDYSKISNSEEIILDKPKYIVIGGRNIIDKDFSIGICNNFLNSTKKYWDAWCNTLVLPKQNRNIIVRSAITLKLLTYSKTGAILAAPTTSIPEQVGTSRTFDYRFCWVRDAAFCVDAFKKIGRDYEAKALMEFMINRIVEDDHIQILYGINGETKLKEIELEHLAGFKNSKPVRIGNAAYNQSQHDIYGELIDIMYLYFGYYGYEKRMTKDYWRVLKYLVNQIKFKWDTKDSGIWEFRGKHEHYLFSKLLCYVGVDRAIKLAQHFDRNDLVNKWLSLRDEIYEDILKKGYNKEVNAFTMFYTSKELDASSLQMTYHDFLDPKDPRIINTVKAIYNELRNDYLVQRYKIRDDFGDPKSSFTICSFWLVDSLFQIGEVEKAKNMYNKLVSRANHLGLFSEDIDIATKKLIGNFPQAYTHIALINSSILLSEWSAKRKKIDWSSIPRKKRWF